MDQKRQLKKEMEKLKKKMKTKQTQKNIPEGWQQVQVADVLDVNPEQINPLNSPDDFFQYIDIAGVKDFNIKELKSFTGAQAPSRARRVVMAGDIIVSNVRPNLKGICRIPEYSVNTLCSTGFSVVRAKDVDCRYAYQVLLQDKFTNYLIDKTTGSNYPAVNSDDVASYNFLLPTSKKEQQKIAEILGAMDEDITKMQEVIDTTEKLKKGLMQRLFTRGIGHTKFKKTKLGELCDFQTGKLNSNRAINGGEYPFFTCSQETFAIDQYSFDQKAILLSGNNAAGKYSVKYYEGKFDAYQRTYVMSIKDEKEASYAYIKEILNARLNELRDSSVGSTTKFLTLKLLQNLPVLLPPISVQQKIAEILSAVDEKISVNKKLKANLTQLKKGLMQDLLSGDKRVKI